jgi:hypothetical protein
MNIDQMNGTIDLPCGLSIGPDLSQDGFRKSPFFLAARSDAYGTMLSFHYHFSGGRLDGKEFLTNLCFYDQLLIRMDLTADCYPPGPRPLDWSTYSLEVEAATKRFHDDLLERILGRPSKIINGGVQPPLPDSQATLGRLYSWQFSWGRVSSYHDSRGGGTYITVRYGNRREKANRAYWFRLFRSGTKQVHPLWDRELDG